MEKNYKQLLGAITTCIFDVDGVLTDSSVILLPSGDQARTMSVRDGYALQLAVKKGFNICIISGGSSEAVRDRLEKLGVQDVFLGVANKIEVYEQYINDHNLSPEQVLYMGDDIPDYHVMRKAGLAVCPANAAEEIKSIAHYVSNVPGGKGCVRDVIEQMLKVQGKWFDKDSFEW